MRLWDLRSKKCIALATGHTEAIGSTALSQKVARYEVGGKAARNGAGAFVVTVSSDRTLKRWNLPGCGVLDKGLKEVETDGFLQLDVFCSTRAHEKVRV